MAINDIRSSNHLIDVLTRKLQDKVPQAKLQCQPLPLAPEINLVLIEEAYPQHNLSTEQVAFLMDSPPYWAFCWASGQVMARHLLDNPSLVNGKTVVDFGCGSGVVAIAAKLAGAQQVLAVDIDESALLATQINAQINAVAVEAVTNVEHVSFNQRSATLLVADVFYDADNIPMLANFIRQYGDIIVADSRIKPSSLTGMCEHARYQSSTVPDLGESSDFNSVGVYVVK